MLCIVGSPLYQWDANRQLRIDSDTLGDKFEIHCCMKGDTSSRVVEPIIDGDMAIVNIPNILLQRSGTLRVYVVTEGDTIYDQSFYVLARPKPDSYIYTETEVQTWSDIEKYVQKEITEAKTEVSESVNNVIGRTNDLYANALKGSKSGATILLDDVSPLEHTLDVKVSGVQDTSMVKVKVQGKNLADRETMRNLALWQTATYSHYPIYVGKGTTVTVSVKNKPDAGKGVFVVIGYAETHRGEGSGAWLYHSSASGLIKDTVTVTSEDGYIYVQYAHSGVGGKLQEVMDEILFDNDLQIEIGSERTAYEPYVAPVEYAVEADGSVMGVKSIYPTTMITTDTEGAIVECEYNKDINKAFAEMYNALFSMGGNV